MSTRYIALDRRFVPYAREDAHDSRDFARLLDPEAWTSTWSDLNAAQVSSHVSRAFYRAAQAVGSAQLSAIALPRTELHIDRARRIKRALRQLNLEVFWSDPSFA